MEKLTRREVLLTISASVPLGMFYLGFRSLWDQLNAEEVDVDSEAINDQSVIKSIFQPTIPVLNQQDERWSNLILGLNEPGSNGTIGNYGCLITSLAAIKSAQGEFSSPKQINQMLLEGGGFSTQGYFNRTTGFPALGLTEKWTSERYVDVPFNGIALFMTRTYLDQGHPVICEVNINDSELTVTNGPSQHFVVLQGYRQDHEGTFFYQFMDPWVGQSRELHQKDFIDKAWSAIVLDHQIPTKFATFKPESITKPPIIFDQDYQDGSSLPREVLRWGPGVDYYASLFNLESSIIKSMMYQESYGDPLAVSKDDAVGLLQIMPRDKKGEVHQCKNGPCFGDRPTYSELFDPDFNLFWGCKILEELLNHHDGDYREALKNYGPMDMEYKYADIVLNIMKHNYHDS